MTKKPITETLLEICGNSSTEIARRLTMSSEIYYTTNQVAHWIRSEKVPPEHAQHVAKAFGLEIEDVVPELFGMHHKQSKG